jgi:hypothetical protein
MATKLRLAVSALARRVYVGRVNKSGDAFLDGKQDVTSDFFKAVIDYFEEGKEIVASDGAKWKVSCVPIPSSTSSESQP